MRSAAIGIEFLIKLRRRQMQEIPATPQEEAEIRNKLILEAWKKADTDDNALDKQTGGTHYKDMPIQPAEYAEKNSLSLLEGNVVKYISRWKKKGSPLQDLEKAKHCIDLLIEIHGVDK